MPNENGGFRQGLRNFWQGAKPQTGAQWAQLALFGPGASLGRGLMNAWQNRSSQQMGPPANLAGGYPMPQRGPSTGPGAPLPSWMYPGSGSRQEGPRSIWETPYTYGSGRVVADPSSPDFIGPPEHLRGDGMAAPRGPARPPTRRPGAGGGSTIAEGRDAQNYVEGLRWNGARNVGLSDAEQQLRLTQRFQQIR